ncbi:MAG TPA: 50S ribosomal protein L30 [Spirochaetes bacterium]|nr:50S ribosomal protein L30 [Spirochaetota bacterium]
MSKKIEIKQIRSSISKKPKQRATLRALGLRRINAARIHEDNQVIRGMIDKVKHLVQVSEIQK